MSVYRNPVVIIKDLWIQTFPEGPVSGQNSISLKPGGSDAVFVQKPIIHVM